MFKSSLLKFYMGFGVAAALVYCIPEYFFIVEADYTRTVLLYLGNFLFMLVIGAFLFYIRRLKQSDFHTLDLIIAGQKQVLRSVAITVILSFLLLLVLVPGLLEGVPGKWIVNKPANTIHDKTNGLDFMVLVNAALGNFLTGSFAGIILPPSINFRSGKKNPG